MKKNRHLLTWVMLLMGAVSFTACDDDNTPTVSYQVFNDGAYIVNAGNIYSNIESTLTHIDFNAVTARQGVFRAVNGRSLGSTANDGVVYGSKIYVVVDQSNTIEVLDRKTLRSIQQISTTLLLGNAEGQEPRHVLPGYGHIFVTTYGGYVAAIDTLKYGLSAKYKVGDYPEGMASHGNFLYVANSNYGQGGGNISAINLTLSDKDENAVQTLNIEGVNNPTKLFCTDDALYVLDNQYWDANYNSYGENALRRVSGSTTSFKVADCNYACLYQTEHDTNIYLVNAPYGSNEVTYHVFNTSSRTLTDLNLSEKVVSPCGIEVNPVTGNLYVLSNNLGDGGYVDYNADGYVVEYDNEGNKLHQYNTGVGPCAIFFDFGVNVVR